jgi:ERCC4-type nuclease
MGEKIRPITSKLNPKAGTQPEWEFSFPEGFVLIVDSREQTNLFSKPQKGLLITRDTLKYGDYSVRGFESQIGIERKNVMDLFQSLGKERDRFKRELEGLSKFHRKWIVVEGTEDEILSFQNYTKMHPSSIRQSLVSIEIRLGIGIHYEPDRKSLERWVLDRFLFFYKLKRGLVHQ